MIGTGDEPLFTPEDMQAIRDRMEEIQARIRERAGELESLADGHGTRPEEEPQPVPKKRTRTGSRRSGSP